MFFNDKIKVMILKMGKHKHEKKKNSSPKEVKILERYILRMICIGCEGDMGMWKIVVLEVVMKRNLWNSCNHWETT